MSVWLVLCYAALALGLAWSLTGSANWKRRVPYILCAPPLAIALWLGKPDPAGWPTSAKAPKTARLVWGFVDEPTPQTNDPGHIYLWLDVGGRSPRAYTLPYRRKLHEQLQRALKAVQHGQTVGVRRTPVRHAARGHTGGQAGTRAALRFYPEPPVLLPPKTH